MRYSGGDGQTLGIVLTPRHICDLFCDLLNIQTTDIVLDPCCGTAGFLVAAMHHMLEKAGADQNKRKNIKKKQLHGFELQSNMFAIAATNMILRDDGNSNIKCEDFLRQNPAQVRLKGATVGMMNPPYSQGTKSDPSQYELSFVEHLLDSLTEGARAAVIVPQSSMTGKTKDEQTFKENILKHHTLEGVITCNTDTFYGIKLLRNPVYVQADMDIYEYFKAQGVKIESPPEMFTGDNSCYLYQGREGEEQILVIAPHQGRIPSSLWLTVQRKLSQNTSFQNGRKCHNTWLAGKIKCGRCGYALVGLRAQNGVTYLRCKQRADNGSCEGAGTLTAQSMESFVYGEMVEKMRKYHTLKGGKEPGYNPKLTAARVALAKTESEIEKLLDTLSGANPLLLQYANNRIEELDAERQKQLKLVADLTANSVSDTQIDCITNYLNDWESVSFDDKRKVVDILISHIDATSESVTIHWKI